MRAQLEDQIKQLKDVFARKQQEKNRILIEGVLTEESTMQDKVKHQGSKKCKETPKQQISEKPKETPSTKEPEKPKPPKVSIQPSMQTSNSAKAKDNERPSARIELSMKYVDDTTAMISGIKQWL